MTGARRLPQVRGLYVALASMLSAGFLLAGCSSKSSHQIQVVLPSPAFDSASASLKQSWQNAATCVANNDYWGAATNLIALRSHTNEFTVQQRTAFDNAWETLGNAAFQAAEKGDQQATRAVQEMRRGITR